MIPTLIIVRAALGWSVVSDDGNTVTTFQAESRTGAIFTTQLTVNDLSVLGDTTDSTRDCVV
jgi:hypothetical protein